MNTTLVAYRECVDCTTTEAAQRRLYLADLFRAPLGLLPDAWPSLYEAVDRACAVPQPCRPKPGLFVS